jgi:protein involved in sex pheromone biosynthesis
MKKTAFLSVAIMSLLLSACNSTMNNNNHMESGDSAKSKVSSQVFNLDTTKLKSGDAFYQCEMNPEVLSDKPGSCPTCGMDLSEIKKK